MGPIMCRKRDDGLDEHAEVLDHCPTHPPPSLFIFLRRKYKTAKVLNILFDLTDCVKKREKIKYHTKIRG